MVELVASTLEALYPSSSTKLGKVVFNMISLISHLSDNSFILLL